MFKKKIHPFVTFLVVIIILEVLNRVGLLPIKFSSIFTWLTS